jgi:hypothetical protein
MSSRARAAATLLGTIGALLAAMACSNPAPVQPTTVSSVLVTGPVPSVGSTSAFTAIAMSSDGTGISVGTQAIWNCSDISVATVNESGTVTGIGAGEADITATYRGVTGRAHIVLVGNQAATPATYTLSVTLAQGHRLSGPYGATLSGPNGFTCYMSPSQDNVKCLVTSFPSGTYVPIVVAITVPAFANDWPIWETSGCDSTTMNTCTVLMNANRVVTIMAGRT